MYVDESGFQAELNQEKCWFPAGQPVFADRSGQRKKRINLFCGLNAAFEPVAPYLTEENCRASNFEEWFEYLLSHLHKDEVIVMDNAKFHRKTFLFEFIKAYNKLYNTRFSLLFLPPYSPDFNPIEKFFGVLKQKIKGLAYLGTGKTNYKKSSKK